MLTWSYSAMWLPKGWGGHTTPIIDYLPVFDLGGPKAGEASSFTDWGKPSSLGLSFTLLSSSAGNISEPGPNSSMGLGI